MDYFGLYLLTVLASLSSALIWTTVLTWSAVVALAVTVAVMTAETHGGYLSEKAEGVLKTTWLPYFKKSLKYAVISSVLLVATPDKNNMIFIGVGGALLTNDVDDKTMAVLTKALDITESELDAIIAEADDE